ncbi:MAG: hypothetical protein ACRD3B_03080, partial [Candidatus Sulfotelmatobacter sp.]
MKLIVAECLGLAVLFSGVLLGQQSQSSVQGQLAAVPTPVAGAANLSSAPTPPSPPPSGAASAKHKL